ncbi:MAG: hypothetical protein NTZ56_01490 [Acidobacteria bacterium]|nr:hypothetical protein [Acidobacteriota bacterium]
MPRPIVLLHGYSDQGASFSAWKAILMQNGYLETDIKICSYRSLVNEINISDIAEGFEAVLAQAGVGPNDSFDAVVHSTGMLVLRSWLARFAKNVRRLKHLIGLAPATFGSPLAAKGRSFIGALVKGNKEPGPDFLEPGDLFLDALECGSRFTWDLAHKDLLGGKVFYGPGPNTPYPFIFVGTEPFDGFARFASDPGTDGCVRWSQVGLNAVKFTLDLSGPPGGAEEERRTHSDPPRIELPVTLLGKMNHGTILSKPTPELQKLFLSALAVNDEAAYAKWLIDAAVVSDPVKAKVKPYQHFVTHVVDERGDGIKDYFLDLFTRDAKGKEKSLTKQADLDVHNYSADPSYRSIHVDLSRLKDAMKGDIRLRLIANTGTNYAKYVGYQAEIETGGPSWSAEIELPTSTSPTGLAFFYPFSTTLVEIVLNRQVADVIKLGTGF